MYRRRRPGNKVVGGLDVYEKVVKRYRRRWPEGTGGGGGEVKYDEGGGQEG